MRPHTSRPAPVANRGGAGSGSETATPHQLAHRTLLSGAIRLCDLTLLAVVVLAARCLGADGFGLFTFGLALASVVVTPLIEGLAPMMAKSAARDPQHIGQQLGTMLPMQTVITAGLLVLGWMVMTWLRWSPERQAIALVMGGALGARGPLEILRAAVRGRGRLDIELKIIGMERMLLLTSAAVVLLLGGGPLRLGACFIGARLVSAGAAFRWVRVLGHAPRWQSTGWSRCLAESLPYGASMFIYAVHDQVSILCLSWLWNDAMTGAYSAAYRLYEGVGSLAQILVLVLLPELAVRHASAPQLVEPLVRKATRYAALVALPVAAGFLMEGPWLIGRLYGGQYHEAVRSLQILAVGLLPLFTRQIAGAALWALDRQRVALAATAAGGIANVAFSLWLIPSHGAAGAAAAMALSASLVWGWMWIVLWQHGIRWPWLSAALKPGIVALTIGLALWRLHGQPWAFRMIGAGLAGLAAVVLIGAVSPKEWALVRGLVQLRAVRPDDGGTL